MNRIMIRVIDFYRNYISGYLGHSKCRFIPTCSSYAAQAYAKYGFLKATGLTLYRILRCNPWGKGGYDPLQ